MSHAAAMIQRAGEIALRHVGGEIEEMVEVIRERVAFVYDALCGESSISVARPEGAFYVFPRVEGVEDSLAFAEALLRTESVAVAPGVAFGKAGEGAVRLCCAADRSILEPAVERFCHFVRNYV